jgi:peroxiredoxin
MTIPTLRLTPKIFAAAALSLVAAASTPIGSHAAVTIGAPAPDFSVASASGATESLSAHRGKYVVLEWLNHDCPYVRKHYDNGNMQRLQKELTAKGVVWMSVISSAPGKQGHSTPTGALSDAQTKGATPTAILLDEKGDVGKLYGATTTPHMFVVDPDGTLIYMGAIDDRPSFDAASLDGATNWVEKALEEAMSGRPVTTSATKQYGCSVKY